MSRQFLYAFKLNVNIRGAMHYVATSKCHTRNTDQKYPTTAPSRALFFFFRKTGWHLICMRGSQ